MATQTIVDGVTLSAASWANDVDSAAYAHFTGVAGTNTLTATGPANFTYLAGAYGRFIPVTTNTVSTTLNITPSGGAALGAKNVFYNGRALVGGELITGVPAQVVYDGSRFQLVSPIPGTGTLGTEVTLSGTTVDFTGIPSWATEIDVHVVGASLSGNTAMILQLGDAGGIENNGYSGAAAQVSGATTNTGAISLSFATISAVATAVFHGHFRLVREDTSDNTWTCTAIIARSDTAVLDWIAGSKALSATLDRVRLGSADGTSTFDAGVANITYR